MNRKETGRNRYMSLFFFLFFLFLPSVESFLEFTGAKILRSPNGTQLPLFIKPEYTNEMSVDDSNCIEKYWFFYLGVYFCTIEGSGKYLCKTNVGTLEELRVWISWLHMVNYTCLATLVQRRAA